MKDECEQFGAVIVICSQYEYFRGVDIDMRLYKLHTQMINQMSCRSIFLPL